MQSRIIAIRRPIGCALAVILDGTREPRPSLINSVEKLEVSLAWLASFWNSPNETGTEWLRTNEIR